jgi:hypothetical protein
MQRKKQIPLGMTNKKASATAKTRARAKDRQKQQPGVIEVDFFGC